MNVTALLYLETAPWYALGVYWAVSALRVKPTKVKEGAGGRLLHIGAMVLVFLLLASHRLDVGLLARRFVSESSLLTGFGIFLTFVGAAIAIWARYCLGQYWSARVTLKMDHRLIRSGPYTYVRHPIYSGLLLAMAGTALVIGEWRAVVAVLIAILEFSRKASKEEVFLTTEFNVDYQEYRKHAGFLIPRFR